MITEDPIDQINTIVTLETAHEADRILVGMYCTKVKMSTHFKLDTKCRFYNEGILKTVHVIFLVKILEVKMW